MRARKLRRQSEILLGNKDGEKETNETWENMN